MCGIAGIIGMSASEEKLKMMMKPIAHRGPDGHNQYIRKDVALGHYRLAIVELSDKGDQPMRSGQDSWMMVYNGELYNHLDLRKRFLPGYSFKGYSDAETFLELFVRYGVRILPELNGIFSCCIYNEKSHEAFLIRDAAGVKPCYYFWKNKELHFCSELKGLLELTPFTINAQALFDYLSFLWPHPQETITQGIRQLPAGSFLHLRNDEMEICSFPQSKMVQKSHSSPVDELENILLQVIERQLMADVPIGLSLSGGVDSALLLALLSGPMGLKNIPCFTADPGKAFEHEGFGNDLFYAKQIAQHFQADLEIISGDQFSWTAFDKMVWQCDGPVADVAAILMGNISSAAHIRGLKVLMSGLGADEVFGGYRRHQLIRYHKMLRILKAAYPLLPPFLNPGIQRRLKKLYQAYDSDLAMMWYQLLQWLPSFDTLALIHADLWKDVIPERMLESIQQSQFNTPQQLNGLLQWEQDYYLPAHNLNYADKMGMMQAVEIRVPYLDQQIIQWARQLTDEQLIRRGVSKYLLKKVAIRYLPKEVVHRKKTGFGWPVRTQLQQNKAFTEELKSRVMADVLYDEKWLNKAAVQQLFEDTMNNKRDGTYTLMSIAAYESWYRQLQQIV